MPDPDRHCADRLCAKPRGARKYVAEFHGSSTSRERWPWQSCRHAGLPGAGPQGSYIRISPTRSSHRTRLPVCDADWRYRHIRSHVYLQVAREGSGSGRGNIRNDMYLASERSSVSTRTRPPRSRPTRSAKLDTYKKSLDAGTRFIPTWVKVAVAFALGLGTMVGWKRIVVTVGEKIGKSHLTYAQGLSPPSWWRWARSPAPIMLGLPVSTTHVLSSGVAGTMAANRSGLQMNTIRNLLMGLGADAAVSILLSGALYNALLENILRRRAYGFDRRAARAHPARSDLGI